LVTNMRIGIHLPQFGRAISTRGIQRAAVQAESLGFDDVWVSDHLVVPADQAYPGPYLYDPLMALAFAGAVTERVGLGTSVLVATQYPSPLAVANSLASLDYLSGGRLIAGAGIGWSRAEYEALGAAFSQRGRRLEEIISLWRTAWKDDPATHAGDFYPFENIRILPKPAHPIPIWLGGTSDVAIQRAARLADGYHGIGLSPDQAAALVRRIRAVRPDETFTISMRLGWDAAVEPETVQANMAGYEAAGIQHVLYALDRGDIEEWLRGVERVAAVVGLAA
jgi:probable F420-dependent oxidoreductase